MNALAELPELAALDARRGLVRIPPELDVPLTDRVRRLIDTPEFHRLAKISQLGLVALVYPAANHTRFEHSLGVYRLALLYLRQLEADARFREAMTPHDAEVFLAAALLHDLGHWPFCHPIEDIALAGVPEHEQYARNYLSEGELAGVLRTDWGIEPREVVSLLEKTARSRAERIASSLLSGPIDIDKMDYLVRDSLHAGVPYGRNYDQQRLIGSLCLNEAGDGLAITDKGRTAAEMMVFARYVMFSEVYWHHGVRSATAMLQRAFALLYRRLDLDRLFRGTEDVLLSALRDAAGDTPPRVLLEGLFGSRRRLYKGVAQYSYFENRELYHRLARRPYAWLVRCAERFAARASAAVGRPIPAHGILFDAPPVGREVEFRVDIFFPKEGRYRSLGEVSPVVRTLATEQFDDYVKRVRIFTDPDFAADLRGRSDLDELVARSVADADADA